LFAILSSLYDESKEVYGWVKLIDALLVVDLDSLSAFLVAHLFEQNLSVYLSNCEDAAS
jgi:hypothetical protein